MLNVLMFNIFAALATGGAVICAHEIGRVKSKHDESNGYPDARCAAKHLLLVVLIASVAIAVIAYFLRARLLRLCFGAIEDDVMQSALVYFVISCISYPFIALYNGLAALFRTMGNSKVTMIASTIVNLVNIAGNALLIYVFDMGVAGAAWASTFSRFVGMLILFVLILNKNRDIFLDFREKFIPEAGTVRRILRIGVANSLENSVFQLGRILVISMIAGFGTVQLAANSVANNLDSLGCIPDMRCVLR